MTKKYCIYSNFPVDEQLMNKEHILPKKIGGHLDFSVMVEKEINAVLGSKVDAPFTESTLIKLLCKDYNFKGHSKKTTSTFKKSIIVETGDIVDISLINNKMLFHKKCQKDSKGWTKSLEETKAKSIKVEFKINPEIYLRFVSKLFLSSGYFLYGDCFVENSFHIDLRKLMKSETPSDLIAKKEVKTIILSDQLNPDPFMNLLLANLDILKNYHIIWTSFAQNAVMIRCCLFGKSYLSSNCVISDKPDKFLQHTKGDVILKEIGCNSNRQLIQITQEDFVKTFIESRI